jgi:ribonuclease BN (tRNA processing enzyme)
MPAETPTLTVLGAGSAFSRLYGTTCSMLELPKAGRFLIDCGRQAPDQVHARGLSWWDFRGQILTHVHGDHAYGCEDLALMRYYGGPNLGKPIIVGGERPALVAHQAVRAELWEVLSPSLRFRSDSKGRAVDGTLEDYFDVVSASGSESSSHGRWQHAETFSLEDLTLTARESHHITGKPSTSLEIRVDGERIAWWGGDCTVNPELLCALAPRTTVFFHDCTFGELDTMVHGAFSALQKLPESVRKKVVLMHHDDDLAAHVHRAFALGFRVLLPGQVYDLARGELVSGSTAP